MTENAWNYLNHPIGIVAAEAAPKTKSSNYPEPFYSRMSKRQKRPLGDLFGLMNYGVNLTQLAARRTIGLAP